MKLALQAALVVLLAIAIYYRFVRHDALKYYLFFGACAVVLGMYVFRFTSSK
jgi:hypothetical protein